MNEKLQSFKKSLKNKEICVIGIGISHLPLIDFLLANGAHVTACDAKTKEQLGDVYDSLLSKGVCLKLGKDYLADLSGDLIFKTPGLRYDVPELLEAERKGIPVTSEMEEFMKICPAPVTAITGSDGKTTTTTLIYKMLSMAGFVTHVGGNIGKPLLPSIETIGENDRVVLELSSFQLHTMKNSPQTAVITNLSPNHLDYHKDYQEYIDAKSSIFRYQNQDGLLILNEDNEDSKKLKSQGKGKVLTFSTTKKADVWLNGDMIMYHDEPVLNRLDIKIPGKHNVENYMTAIAAVYPLVGAEVVNTCAKEFGGVAHRIEFVREIDGVKYYNSSIDSSPNRTINSLNVFKEPVVLIAGGKDKGIPYDALGPAVRDHVKALILVGYQLKNNTSEVIAKVVKESAPQIPIFMEESYEQGVIKAKEQAKAGDVVLLSNASTSFDMFRNFEERGNLFKELVMSL